MKIRLLNGRYVKTCPYKYFEMYGSKFGVHRMHKKNGQRMNGVYAVSLVPYGVRIPLSEAGKVDKAESSAKTVLRQLDKETWEAAKAEAVRVWRESGSPW